jgi:hypothetical protein
VQPAGKSRGFPDTKFIAAFSREARDLPEMIGQILPVGAIRQLG